MSTLPEDQGGDYQFDLLTTLQAVFFKAPSAGATRVLGWLAIMTGRVDGVITLDKNELAGLSRMPDEAFGDALESALSCRLGYISQLSPLTYRWDLAEIEELARRAAENGFVFAGRIQGLRRPPSQ